MKFSEFEYKRPDLSTWKADFLEKLAAFQAADHFSAQVEAMDAINGLRSHVETMQSLASTRHSIDINDEFYKSEQDFFDEAGPEFEEMTTAFYEALVVARFREQLEAKYGHQLFALAEAQLKTFSPEIIPLLQQENKLVSEYEKLIASAQISFDGNECTLAQIDPYLENVDRDVRKGALDAKFGFFADNVASFDSIYDQLVKVRTEIAVKLGYENYVELGYHRLARTDYDAEMVANYRKQIRDRIVPLATKLYQKQAKRIGVEKLQFHDEMFRFKTGNATPQGSPEWIVENGQKMYQELSAETNGFFQFMTENGLMDLVAKKGKMAGGYCTFFQSYQSPFIFSNFNGTSADIDVLTHEVGHAFQCYLSRTLEVPEYGFPTLEACEIHSMSMEFFAWPWMELFFKEQTNKYHYDHLASAVLFLPYGVLVDEFQHVVYEHPEMTPAERRFAWSKLEKVYMPHLDFGDNSYLNDGGRWQRQGHIYGSPFYYIDYTLAQVCAFQFWKRMHENPQAAWQDYLHLCQLGGSKSFVELVREANLISPFADGCVASVVSELEEWFDRTDDERL